jgi:hypothetical protein
MSETEIRCKHCQQEIHSTAGVDPNVPWVHNHSGNALCDVHSPADAVMLLGVDAQEAEPVRSEDMLADAIIADLDERYDLIYINQGDQLTDKQTNAIVRGDTDALWEDLDEWESEARAYGVKYVIDEAVKDVIRAWEREDSTDDEDADYAEIAEEFEHSDAWERVREEIEERDSGKWVNDLVRATPSVLLRIPIDAIDEDHAYSFEPVEPDEVLTRLSMPVTDENRAVIQYVLDNSSPEFSVLMGYWIVGADVKQIWDLPRDEDAEVEITDPYLYLGNPFTGSGFISEKPITGTTRVKREDLRTDKDAFGYSVNEVYGGLYASSFEADIKAVPPTQAPAGETE